MKFEKLKPGMVVYDVGRQRLGNTMLSTVVVWSVKIISVDAEKRTVDAEWNHNRARIYRERDYKKWRAVAPMLISAGPFGGKRLATKDEIAAAKRNAEDEL